MSESAVDRLIEFRRPFLEKRGYYFNPDETMTRDLLAGLLVNEERYGYPFCPCRLATGDIAKDRDAICPCDVRDWDVGVFGTCYCGLYVSREVYMDKKEIQAIPDRRDQSKPKNQLWRCQVCGYLCSRPQPPDVCPVCGVTHDRFEPFVL